MPTIQIPSQESGIFTKPSRGDKFGTLFATRNIDLDRVKGKIRLSERTYRLLDSGDDADFEIPVKFIRTDADKTDRWIALVQNAATSTSDGLIFKSTDTNPTSAWAQDAITSVLTGSIDPTASTAVVGVGTLFTTELSVGDRIIVSGETRTVTVITDDTHLTVDSAFSDNANDASPDKLSTPLDACWDMEIFGQANSYDRLVVARDDNLALLNNGVWTSSWWVLTLGKTAMSTSNPHLLEQFLNLLIVTDGNVVHTIDDSLVVNTNRITLPKEYQIIWTANDGHRIYFGTKNTRGLPSLVFPWNGTSKTYDSPLPVYDSYSLAGVAKDGIMHVINGKGQLLANNGSAFEEVAALPVASAVKEWINKYAALAYRVHANGMAIIDGNIHILLDGMMLHASTKPFLEDQLSGIWAYEPGIGLYNKYSIGQYDGATDDDWGAGRVSKVGALAETDKQNGKFLAGATVYSDGASTEIDALITLQGEDTVTQRGYFITPKMSPEGAIAFWRRMTLVFKKMKNSTDRIIIKYRVEEDATLISNNGGLKYFTATWTDTDTFTIADATFSVVVAGEEVEFLCGKGAGATAHISTITGASPNYTVNLDEPIPNATGTAIVRVQNWTKLGAVSSQAIRRKTYRIAKKSPWIQFKVELRGDHQSPEVEKLLSNYEDQNLI